ncbi:MAG: hypothetical protein DRQ47_07150 [Gammaproteobacteria bacterium]|nr:MAG: hypothetical protein DRQ47_07150 [Gammaproteobacteria bacterium]
MAGFNKNQFIKQAFKPRTEVVPVPSLADWFDKGSKPEWTVRSLTGNEMAIAQEALAKSKNVAAIAEALLSSKQSDKIEALKEFVGTADSVHEQVSKRLEMLVFGSVKPEIDMSIAVKIADNFPIEFAILSTKILQLTGLGSSSLKRRPSGKTSLSEDV